MAERVGFEPTCLALNETNRFRVDPVTTTSVPLRIKTLSMERLSLFREETLHQASAFFFKYAVDYL
jgi:hypothetical protein